MADSTEQLQHTAELDARVDQLLRDMDAAAARKIEQVESDLVTADAVIAPDKTGELAAPAQSEGAMTEATVAAPPVVDAPEIEVLDEQLAQQAERIASEPEMHGAVSGAVSSRADSPSPASGGEGKGGSAAWIAALAEDEFTTIEALLGEVAAEVEAASAQREAIGAEGAAESPAESAVGGAPSETATPVDEKVDEAVDAAAEAGVDRVAEKVPEPEPVASEPAPIAVKPVTPTVPRVVVPPAPDDSPPTPAPVAPSPLKPVVASEEPVEPTSPATAPVGAEPSPKAETAGPGEEVASIEKLDEALAANAEKAVESAPAVGPAPTTAPAAVAQEKPAAATAAPPKAEEPAAATARPPTAEAQGAPLAEGAEARPGAAKRGGVSVILASALWPLASVTAKLPLTARQTIGYAAATTIFNAACLWGFIAFRSSSADETHTGTGVRFLHPGDPAPEPTPHKASAADSHEGESKDAGHGKAAEGHGKPPAKASAKSEKDAHGKSGAADAHGKSASAKPAKAKSTKGAAKADAHGGH